MKVYTASWLCSLLCYSDVQYPGTARAVWQVQAVPFRTGLQCQDMTSQPSTAVNNSGKPRRVIHVLAYVLLVSNKLKSQNDRLTLILLRMFHLPPIIVGTSRRATLHPHPVITAGPALPPQLSANHSQISTSTPGTPSIAIHSFTFTFTFTFTVTVTVTLTMQFDHSIKQIKLTNL